MNSYHITLARSVPNILARGLQPRIGPRSKELGEHERAVYLYKTKKDVKEALENWFGGCFFGEDLENIVVLEVNFGKNLDALAEGENEIIIHDLIPPEAIKRVLAKDVKSDISDQFSPADISIPPEVPVEDEKDNFFGLF